MYDYHSTYLSARISTLICYVKFFIHRRSAAPGCDATRPGKLRRAASDTRVRRGSGTAQSRLAHPGDVDVIQKDVVVTRPRAADATPDRGPLPHLEAVREAVAAVEVLH